MTAETSDSPSASLSELAKHLDITEPTLRAFLDKHPDFPVVQKGGRGKAYAFDLTEAIPFYRQRKVEEEEAEEARKAQLAQIAFDLGDSVSQRPKGMAPAEYRVHLQNEQLARRLRIEAGDLIVASEMRALLRDPFSHARKGFLNVGRKVGRQHALPPEVVQAITDEIKAVLSHLVDSLIEIAGEAPSSE